MAIILGIDPGSRVTGYLDAAAFRAHLQKLAR